MKRLIVWLLELRIFFLEEKRASLSREFLEAFGRGSHAKAAYKQRDIDQINEKIEAVKVKLANAGGELK